MYLAGVNADVHCGAVDLFPGYPLNMDDPLLSVDSHNLAFSALHADKSRSTLMHCYSAH